MAAPALDIEEWDLVIDKLARHHHIISEEIAVIIQEIREKMKPELVPLAEEKASYGKTIKAAIRSMWDLEYEIEDLQKEFAKGIGSVDINNLTDDFVEDVMLQSKPLQSVLLNIRNRQKDKMEDLKKQFGEKIKDLEPLYIVRPTNEEAKKVKAEKAAALKAAQGGDKPAEEKKPEEAAPAPAEAAPAEPAPAVDAAAAPAAVEASA